MAAGSPGAAGPTSSPAVAGVAPINNPGRPAGVTPSITGMSAPGIAPFTANFAAPGPGGAPFQNPAVNPLQRNLASAIPGVGMTPVSEVSPPPVLGGPHPLPPAPSVPLPAGFPNPFAISQLQIPATGAVPQPAPPQAGPNAGQNPYNLPPMGGGSPAVQTVTGPQGNLPGLGNFGSGGINTLTPGGQALPPPLPGPMPSFPGFPGAFPGSAPTGMMGAAPPAYPGAPQPGFPGAPQPGFPGAPQAAYPGMPAPQGMPGMGFPIPGTGAPLPQGPAPGMPGGAPVGAAPGGPPNPANNPNLVQQSPYLSQLAWHLMHTPHFGQFMGPYWPQTLQRQDIQQKLLHLAVSQILSPEVQGLLREVATGQCEHMKFAQAVASRIKPTLESVGVLPRS